ncbi:PREDICTED: leucine-rich repeat-containing protein 24-like [Branchiostoma belcheri]|uniref:Leucine-rich repeat-containing protein 24-like n=1 Tax=Branchiostoma belcheri TaxID=7741 RepID=A0A6P4ZXG0_BRABE|nr:PREDICTED: leucine-rich repeat-containing protein 24-like [Branchiostoma belcheri]
MTDRMKRFLVLLLIILKEAGPTAACSSSYPSYYDCSDRVLTSVPQDLPTYITFLILSGSNITTVSQSDFSRYSNLTHKLLEHNQISLINSGAFYNLSRLYQMYLYNNQLTSLRTDIFVGLENLFELSLANNNIHSFEAGTLNATPQLQRLKLQNNDIKTFPVEALSNLNTSTLSILRMNHNQMETLPSAAYDILASISYYVDISNNPWQCDCRMLPFKLRMNGSYPFEDQITCAGPANLTGKSLLLAVEAEDLVCEETTTTGFSVHTTPSGGSSTPSEEFSLLIGVLCGVAGVVLVSAVSLTIWCRIARKTSFTPDVTELTDCAAPHP